MQISTASLLAAQQARSQAPVQPRAVQAKPDGFEELLFAKAPASPGAPPDAAVAPSKPKAAAPFARPGSQIDIKI